MNSNESEIRSKKTTILTVCLCLCLVVIGTLGYLYYQKHVQAQSLSNSVNSLENNVITKQSEITKLKNPAGAPPSESSATSEVTYTAEIGKYSVKLPSDYAVIEKLDGGGEGGEATHILLAKRDEQKNIFKTTYLTPFEVSASKNYFSASLDETVKKVSTGFELASSKDTVIAGEPAKILKLAGLGTQIKVVFHHKDLGYVISYDGDNAQGEQYYKDFVKSFSFY